MSITKMSWIPDDVLSQALDHAIRTCALSGVLFVPTEEVRARVLSVAGGLGRQDINVEVFPVPPDAGPMTDTDVLAWARNRRGHSLKCVVLPDHRTVTDIMLGQHLAITGHSVEMEGVWPSPLLLTINRM